ncbi:hypothetical protein JZ751_013904 [Albula glossodonta]|uniref:ITPR-interacting domain-containing protein n=1 Tax=Albula glossodonta TaxID=121402 RepID=A0A8T2N5D7_9TELE|nr:hypothetical protein JZ751_013904 [Albula glossodonta]
MDVLNLWDDDPEELLLELGFGSEEPDISVLQQVTSAFSALVTIPPAAPPPAQLTEVSRERRKKLSQLFRRASKRTLSMAQNEPDLPADTSLSANHSPDGVPGPLPSDRRPALKRCSRPGHPETSSLTPLVEEQTPNGSRDASDPPAELLQEEEGSSRVNPPCVTPTAPLRRKSPGDLKAPESFEIEEIHSFDDNSVTGSTAGPTEGADAKFMRTNSCQSDSSGFMEEPVIPAFSQQNSPVPELMKALHAMSGDSTDSQITVKDTADLPPGRDSRGTEKDSLDLHCKTDSLRTVKDTSSLSYGTKGHRSEKDSYDVTGSQITVKDTSDLPSGRDSHGTEKDSSDLHCKIDSLRTVKDNLSSESHSTEKVSSDVTSSQVTVKDISSLSYGTKGHRSEKDSSAITDSQITVKDKYSLPYSREKSENSNSDFTHKTDSLMTVKDTSDLSNGTEKAERTEKDMVTMKHTYDLPYSMDDQRSQGEKSDLHYGADSVSSEKDSSNFRYSAGSQVSLTENSGVPCNADSTKSEKDDLNLPYSSDSRVNLKEDSDIPTSTANETIKQRISGFSNGTGNQKSLSKKPDLTCTTDSEITQEVMSGLPDVTESIGFPHILDRQGDESMNESSDQPCASPSAQQGAPESPQEAGSSPWQLRGQTTGEDGAETSLNPSEPPGAESVLSQKWGGGERVVGGWGGGGAEGSYTERGSAGDSERGGDKVGGSATTGDSVTSPCSNSNDSLPPPDGTVAPKGLSQATHSATSAQTAPTSSEVSPGVESPCTGMSVGTGEVDRKRPTGLRSEGNPKGTGEGSDLLRPDRGSFGSGKSVSVQMPSSLPSVSHTARRRRHRRHPAIPLDLRSEIAEAMAIVEAMTSSTSASHGREKGRGRGYRTRSASLDEGLALKEEEEQDEEAEDVVSLQELRTAVKKEAELLLTQLSDLAHHYDAGIKTKLHRLLDEQSHLCSQLRIRPFVTHQWGPTNTRESPPTGPASPGPQPMSSKSVASQCSLLPDLLVNDVTSPPPGRALTPVQVGTQLNAPDKQDLLDFVGFFQTVMKLHIFEDDGLPGIVFKMYISVTLL